VSDADENQSNSDGSTRTARDDIRGPHNCAEKLWQAALDKDKSANEPFWFHDAKPESNRPSDWLIIFALRQLMIMPDFLKKSLGFGGYITRYSNVDIERAIKIKVGEANAQTGNNSYAHVEAVMTKPGPGCAEMALPSLKAHQSAYRKQMTALLNVWRVAAGGTGNVKIGDLFNQNFIGSDAINKVRDVAIMGLRSQEAREKRLANAPRPIGEKDDANWLRKPDSLDGEFAFVMEEGDGARTAQLSDAARFLFGKENGQALLNCHSEAMRGGLTALVAELFKPQHRGAKGCHLPMLYVPIHGRSCATPDDSLGSLILQIRNFYASLATGGRKSQVGQTGGKPARMNADRMNQLMVETRELMTRHPAILVFDGYRTQRHSAVARDYSLFHLRAAIAGDYVFDLIEQLLMVPTPEAGAAIDVATFGNTRFLITSDFPLFANDGKPLHPHPVLKLVKGRSIGIDPPPASALPGILPMFGNQNPAQLALIREEVLGEREASADAFRSDADDHTQQVGSLAHDIFGHPPPVSESVYGIISTLLKLGIEAPYPALGQATEAEDIEQLIADKLLPLLRAPRYAQWLVLLHFVAIAPGGLRPRTLARVVEDYHEVSGEPLGAGEREGLKLEIAAMLEACNGLVGLCRSDAIEALSDRDLPMLHRDRYDFGREEIRSERAIMFAFNAIREVFIEDACNRDHGGYVALLHLLLAEEAFDQCLQLSRYDDLHVDDSLLRHNRLLAGLYHGTASLMDERMDTAPLHARVGRFLPDDPKQRWIKLYTFAFRKMLDRPPLYALIRQYDAAGLKLDLLLLLLKPQLWRWQQSRQELASLSPALDPSLPAAQDIRRDFRSDILKASSKTLVKLDIVSGSEDGSGSDYVFRDRIESLITGTSMQVANRAREVAAIPDDILARLDKGLAEDHKTGETIEALAGLAQSLVEGDDCVAELEAQARRYAAEIAAKRTVKEMKILADLINLFADATGVEADRVLRDRQTGQPATYVAAVTDRFSRSFGAFYLAESIRMRIFEREPTRSRDTIGGSAGRGFIRVCLKLERQRHRWHESQGHGFKGRGWFWMHAQKILAHLTRYLSAFPRERAGMLILDSALARHCTPVVESENADENRAFLEMALANLRKCEPIIQKLSRHSRLRQRFLLERSKVMAAMARMYRPTNPDLALQYTDLAVADIGTVKMLAPPQNELWHGIADAQSARLKELKDSIIRMTEGSHRPQPAGPKPAA
jgi:hypothetical protein